MYKIRCGTAERAANMLYEFMTGMGLTQPDCSFTRDSRVCVFDREEMSSMTKEQFSKEILGSGIVSCTASTDKKDERRVSLMFLQNLNIIMVNFPYAYNGMTPEEEQLFKALKHMAKEG